MRSAVLSVLFVTVLPVASVGAGDAWFGLKMPSERERRSLADRADYESPAIAPLSLRLAASDDPYTDIAGTDVYRYLEDIIRITEEQRPAGEKYWGRIAGSAAEHATADYLARRFREFGLPDAHTEPVPGNAQWWPVTWQVTLIGDAAYGNGTVDHAFASAFPAAQLGTGAMKVEGLEAELVYVGLGHAVDLLHRDLDGKIAVVRAELQPDPFFQTARGHIEDLVSAGAVGVITIMDAPGNHQYVLELMGSPHVPCFILGGDDGRFLEDALAVAGADRPLRMRLNIDAEVREGWEGKNVLGLIPGETDEYILVTAHLDGFFAAANDNAGGLAAMLALARYFAARADTQPLQRNLLFIGTSAHHEFSDGAKAFIAAHPEILEKTVLVFNIEHPSSIKSYYRGPLRLERVTVPGQLIVTTSQGKRSLTVSNGNPMLISFYKDAIDRYGLVVDASVSRRPTGDAFDFFLAKKPVVQILDANLWFHSSGDRADTIHPNGLERATRLYAFMLDQIDQTDSDALR